MFGVCVANELSCLKICQNVLASSLASDVIVIFVSSAGLIKLAKQNHFPLLPVTQLCRTLNSNKVFECIKKITGISFL